MVLVFLLSVLSAITIQYCMAVLMGKREDSFYKTFVLPKCICKLERLVIFGFLFIYVFSVVERTQGHYSMENLVESYCYDGRLQNLYSKALCKNKNIPKIIKRVHSDINEYRQWG